MKTTAQAKAVLRKEYLRYLKTIESLDCSEELAQYIAADPKPLVEAYEKCAKQDPECPPLKIHGYDSTKGGWTQ